MLLAPTFLRHKNRSTGEFCVRDVFLRTALWEAHRHVCAYCGQLVPFAEMQADHVVPATLKSDAAEMTKVLNGLGLPETANLDDIWNRLQVKFEMSVRGE